MSARNFYIMQSAVAPMQSELPCYTPLTNHRTEVHTVPLVMAADYAALDAECERLADALDRKSVITGDYIARCQRLADERDQLRAVLAAIQQTEGEDVAVLATVSMGGVEYGIAGAELGDIDIEPDMKALCALQQSLVNGEDDAHVELIDKAQHQRIIAAMAAEAATWRSSAVMLEQANAGLAQLNGKLRAELAAIKGQEPAAPEGGEV